MLRVEFQDAGETLIMRLEGRFVGPFAEDTRDRLTRRNIPPRLVVNLSEITFVDAVGEEMLSWLARMGGRFIADNCYPLHVCERLHLPMAPKRAGGSPGRCSAFADVVRAYSRRNGKGVSNMKDDAEDYPVSYLLYVSCTLVAIALVAAVAYVFLT